jgi:hypothetical protein
MEGNKLARVVGPQCIHRIVDTRNPVELRLARLSGSFEYVQDQINDI